MLTQLQISGFRGFRDLEVDGLSQVNLFVGTNNAGKTSILEAAELLAMGTASGLVRGPRRRGEATVVSQEGASSGHRALELSHLFYGHSLKLGAAFKISSTSELWVHCEITDSPQQLFAPPEGFTPVLSYKSSTQENGLLINPFWDSFQPPRPLSVSSSTDSGPVLFLGTEAVSASRLGQLWDSIVLTPEEAGVVTAIQIVEPDIERIAFLGEGRINRSIFLKPAGTEQRIPLGSMGDGLRRLLVLALHLVSAKGGYLLVDEIDTGLHHTVMVDLWTLVIETARRLGVQVLATTHSLDCVRALAWVQEKNQELASEVTLHRIERGLPSTIRYTMDELAAAAEHHLEVR